MRDQGAPHCEENGGWIESNFRERAELWVFPNSIYRFLQHLHAHNGTSTPGSGSRSVRGSRKGRVDQRDRNILRKWNGCRSRGVIDEVRWIAEQRVHNEAIRHARREVSCQCTRGEVSRTNHASRIKRVFECFAKLLLHPHGAAGESQVFEGCPRDCPPVSAGLESQRKSSQSARTLPESKVEICHLRKGQVKTSQARSDLDERVGRHASLPGTRSETNSEL